MFRLVVKYLNFLKNIPLFAITFDCIFWLWNYCFDFKLIKFIDDIESEVAKWDRVLISLHKFGGIEFRTNEKEIGHIHSNGLLDILFDTKIKEELISNSRVQNHHIFKKSGWVSFYIKTESDKAYALELLRLSYDLKISK